jgi:transposase
MGENITIGLDIAKSVFQVHAVDSASQPVLQRQLKRTQVLKFFSALGPVLIGIEACGSAHYWRYWKRFPALASSLHQPWPL